MFGIVKIASDSWTAMTSLKSWAKVSSAGISTASDINGCWSRSDNSESEQAASAIKEKERAARLSCSVTIITLLGFKTRRPRSPVLLRFRPYLRPQQNGPSALGSSDPDRICLPGALVSFGTAS